MHARTLLPVLALLAVGACSNETSTTSANALPLAANAPPPDGTRSVNVVSDALGQRLDNMVNGARASR